MKVWSGSYQENGVRAVGFIHKVTGYDMESDILFNVKVLYIRSLHLVGSGEFSSPAAKRNHHQRNHLSDPDTETKIILLIFHRGPRSLSAWQQATSPG